jgi:hypothetical protein
MQNIAPSNRPDRRIALLKPKISRDGKAAHAMQLLSSMLWAFKGTTRSVWETSGPEEADVAVFHADDAADVRVAHWQANGKQRIPTMQPPVEVPLRAESELSWFAAYNASAELLAGLSSTAAYRMPRWPDFGTIQPPTGQVRAAALLAGQPLDVAQLANRARIPIEEAVRFLNALWVHERLIVSAAVASSPERLGASRGAFGSFLCKLRQHLGLGV